MPPGWYGELNVVVDPECAIVMCGHVWCIWHLIVNAVFGSIHGTFVSVNPNMSILQSLAFAVMILADRKLFCRAIPLIFWWQIRVVFGSMISVEWPHVVLLGSLFYLCCCVCDCSIESTMVV